MISSTTQPKTIRELGTQISKKSTSTSFEVVEVFSKADKKNLTDKFDTYLRKGHFTVVFVGEPK